MRKLIPGLALLLLVSAPAFAKSFAGTYSVSGSGPGVAAYTGTLTVKAREDVYDVLWTIGSAQYGGIGVPNGDGLSVAYTGADKAWIGVMSYKQKSDGSLDGKWAVYGGKATLGTETAKKK
jgi:hypothetical protein